MSNPDENTPKLVPKALQKEMSQQWGYIVASLSFVLMLAPPLFKGLPSPDYMGFILLCTVGMYILAYQIGKIWYSPIHLKKIKQKRKNTESEEEAEEADSP
ncbi:MAG: hypothetical protein HEQ32_02820 [Vampirovibrio sp.]